MDYLYGSNFGRVDLSPGDKLSVWWKGFDSAEILYGKGYLGEELAYTPAGTQIPVPAYFAATPGYDVVVTQNLTGPAIYAVAIRGEDGRFLEKHAPAVSDDLITDHSPADAAAGLLHTITFAELLGNDAGSEVSVATDVQFSNFTKGLWLQDLAVSNEGSYLSVHLDTPTPFFGTTSFQYQVTDPFGDTSAPATVTIDWLGDNTSKDDIHGTEQADVIDFELSTSAVGAHGLGGDDLIRGSQFADSLDGGAGADRIGGKGGDDVISGGSGNDLLFGDGGNDTIDGGADDDRMWGGDGNDILRGGSGHDALYGGNGDDHLGGGVGNDLLHGDAGNDVLWGDDGNDILFGDAGDDSLIGGTGDDILSGGLGLDRLRGGLGEDTFVFVHAETQGDTIVDLEGAGVAGGDRIEFRGYGEGAALHHVSGDVWEIQAADITETFRIAGVTDLAKQDYYFA